MEEFEGRLVKELACDSDGHMGCNSRVLRRIFSLVQSRVGVTGHLNRMLSGLTKLKTV